MKRVLIVDDHPLVRKGFAQLIGDEPDLEVCGEAADEADALQLVAASAPDLVIIDLSLAGGSGINLIERIKAQHSDVRMLVASMHDEALFAERVLAAGALGYLNKQEAPDNIVRAIHRVLDGKVYLSGELTDRLLDGLTGTARVPGQSPMQRLSNRELEVFELIGRGMTTGKIADHLQLSIKTIETHRENIKKKLQLASGQELTRRAMHWVMERD
ncbi:MAG TPA: response regulator transcription factor [Thiolapillus brandeum]|uniref:Response regulator transcription factor n=1 Tax=Thiolapillus brandeum TaxID=1076588 RepID=A0A831RUC7_9GAMM|nr:response regulator transcription factor [Thiolapillus brandeum]